MNVLESSLTLDGLQKNDGKRISVSVNLERNSFDGVEFVACLAESLVKVQGYSDAACWNAIGFAFDMLVVHSNDHGDGEPTPSEADVKITRDLIRAGQLLKIKLLDHIVIGNPNRLSLRSLGCFY